MCAGYADSQMNSDHTKGGGGWGEGDTTGPHREKCIQALVPHQVGIGNRLPVWMGGTGTVMGTDKTDTGRDPGRMALVFAPDLLNTPSFWSRWVVKWLSVSVED